MKSYRLFFILLICNCLIIPSCKKTHNNDQPEETGHITFTFSHKVDGIPLQKDTMMYVNAAGNPYDITEIMYFISDVTLYKSDGTKKVINEWKDINYVDIDIPSTLSWEVFDAIPAGTYDSISFIFGISGEKNQSFMFVNPPEVNMMWPDVLGGGYHYLMINGRWKDNLHVNQPYNYHLGIGQLYKGNVIEVDSIYAFVQNYFRVTLPNSAFTLTVNTTRHIEIIMNIESWFITPHIYDHNYWGGAVMQNQAAMQMIKENGADVFTVGTIN